MLVEKRFEVDGVTFTLSLQTKDAHTHSMITGDRVVKEMVETRLIAAGMRLASRLAKIRRDSQ